MPRASRSFPTTPVIKPGGERVGGNRDLEALVAELQAHPGFGPNITHVHRTKPRPPVYGDWPEALDPRLRAALEARGIERPFSHQSAAMAHALAGRHTVVITPTASGKSLCYNVPMVQALLQDPEARGLYLFPTKALSHDQYREVHALTEACDAGIKVYTYDGDTPPAVRRSLREAGHLVVTNPDMLHAGILPHHTQWIRLFEHLKYIVIDELHQYRGIFGSHMGNVLARLLRLCRFYGSKPVLLCSSATIANPRELAEQLTGEKFELISESGAPAGEKTFLFYNPPVVNRELNVRRSVRLEARRLALRFLARERQVIIFGRSRKDIEVMLTYVKRGMARLHRDPDQVAGYRGGYLPTERRAIEEGLKKKEILGVVSTNALELGIDIGSLDVSILAGYPGTIASALQQAGRAGRKTQASLVIYIAGSSPLDQFFANNAGYFFGSSPENAIVNPANLAVLAAHLKCAAFELPFEDGEPFAGAGDVFPLLQYLEDEHIVRHSGNRWHYSAESYPAEDVSLRAGVEENFIVLDSGRKDEVIAEVDYQSAPFLIHDDAVYIHNGKTYLVEKLDWERRTAFVRHKVLDYYTDAVSQSNVQVLAVDQESEGAPESPLVKRSLGPVSVTTVISKFKKVKFETQESIGYGPVSMPQLEIQTEAAWLSFAEDLPARVGVGAQDVGPLLWGVANLLRHAVPIYVLCDRMDFSVSPVVRAPFDQLPAIYLWDRYPGGIGIARRFFSVEKRVLASALNMVKECQCKAGCPACIGPTLEGKAKIKERAAALLETMASEAKGP